MKFEDELKNGKFVISECSSCKKIVWPCSDICNQCFGNTVWRNSKNIGKIIEFSKHNKYYFCLVEFEETIRIIGKLVSGKPDTNNSVKISSCGIRDRAPFFEMSLI